MRTLSMRSFMRFNARRKVDLPQPEGPIKAVTRLARMSRFDVVQSVLGTVMQIEVPRRQLESVFVFSHGVHAATRRRCKRARRAMAEKLRVKVSRSRTSVVAY